MTVFYDDDCSFERVTRCRFLKLYISMFEKWLSDTAMADGGEQMRSAHAAMHVTSAWGQELQHNERSGRQLKVRVFYKIMLPSWVL